MNALKDLSGMDLLAFEKLSAHKGRYGVFLRTLASALLQHSGMEPTAKE